METVSRNDGPQRNEKRGDRESTSKERKENVTPKRRSQNSDKVTERDRKCPRVERDLEERRRKRMIRHKRQEEARRRRERLRRDRHARYMEAWENEARKRKKEEDRKRMEEDRKRIVAQGKETVSNPEKKSLKEILLTEDLRLSSDSSDNDDASWKRK